MKIIWTDGAAEDLRGIVEHISKDSDDAGRRFAKTLYDRIMGLSSMPYQGRKRTLDDARELFFAPWPYVAIYEIAEGCIFIDGIMHTARDRSG